jgi:hypothetical protein
MESPVRDEPLISLGVLFLLSVERPSCNTQARISDRTRSPYLLMAWPYERECGRALR